MAFNLQQWAAVDFFDLKADLSSLKFEDGEGESQAREDKVDLSGMNEEGKLALLLSQKEESKRGCSAELLPELRPLQTEAVQGVRVQDRCRGQTG